MNNYLVHPHTLFVILPVGFGVTVSLIPVVNMLVYQYCINRDKNFYIYAALMVMLLSAFSLLSDYAGLFKMHKGMNHMILFFIDLTIVYLAYWATKLVIKFKGMGTKRLA
jgi:hypothetical protein